MTDDQCVALMAATIFAGTLASPLGAPTKTLEESAKVAVMLHATVLERLGFEVAKELLTKGQVP